jgi:hypothetical protein
VRQVHRGIADPQAPRTRPCIEGSVFRQMPKDQFKHEVEKELMGRDTEPAEIIYFKLYKSQIPVIEQAIETAALMLGTDKSRGYCLENDLRRFLSRSKPRERQFACPPTIDLAVLQVPPGRRKKNVSGLRSREGIVTGCLPKRLACGLIRSCTSRLHLGVGCFPGHAIF